MSKPSVGGGGKTRPTMRHVAALAGVGIKTVSRVMNEEPGVSESTREKVLLASKQLNYELDVTAGSLRRSSRRTQTVGLLLPSVSNPFSAEIHRAMEDALSLKGVAVFAASLDDEPEREEAMVRAFLGRRVDGMVLTPIASNQAHVIPEHSRDLPVVFIDREPSGLTADAVVTDNAVGGAKAARHLFDVGHRKIAYLGDRTDIQTARERRRGFIDALSELGVSTASIPVRENLHDVESARLAAIEILTSDDPPTALFSSQNLVTFGCMRALRELGLSHTVALVGFDDFTLSDMMDPGVTVIAQHPEKIGALAAERLMARIEGDIQPPKTYIVETTMIIRGSGEIRPAS